MRLYHPNSVWARPDLAAAVLSLSLSCAWCTVECVVHLLCHVLGRQCGHPEVTSVQSLSPEPHCLNFALSRNGQSSAHNASPEGELLPDHSASSFVSAAQLNLNKLPWALKFGCVWHLCHRCVTLLCLQKEEWGCLEHIYYQKMCPHLGPAYALSLCLKSGLFKMWHLAV